MFRTGVLYSPSSSSSAPFLYPPVRQVPTLPPRPPTLPRGGDPSQGDDGSDGGERSEHGRRPLRLLSLNIEHDPGTGSHADTPLFPDPCPYILKRTTRTRLFKTVVVENGGMDSEFHLKADLLPKHLNLTKVRSPLSALVRERD